jgi:hypothetical protein
MVIIGEIVADNTIFQIFLMIVILTITGIIQETETILETAIMEIIKGTAIMEIIKETAITIITKVIITMEIITKGTITMGTITMGITTRGTTMVNIMEMVHA